MSDNPSADDLERDMFLGLDNSPLFWVCVLRSARTSRDTLLESLARRRLTALDCRVYFDSETQKRRKGETR